MSYDHPIASFAPQELVHRIIDGIEFLAQLELVNYQRGTVDLRYLDDNNFEKDVPFTDIRKVKSPGRRPQGENSNIPGRSNNHTSTTLPRPLAGLVEDDYETRNTVSPIVYVHENSRTDEVILMNGAENKLAAGGGLRALRYLKS